MRIDLKLQNPNGSDSRLRGNDGGRFFVFPDYSGLTKIRTRRGSRRQYKQYGTDSLGASAP
ncbi:hypothetical protein FBS88_06400 [Neisseria gonorrhoeae]